MADNDKKDVFISYCTKNKELAQLFCNVVEGAGILCWMAPRDIPPGDRWATAIQKGVEDATIFALLVSDASMNSAEVEKEVDLANGSKKIILPIRIEEKAELKGSFKYHLSNKQWIDAFEPNPLSRFDAAIDAILQNLGNEVSEGEKSGSGYLALARILANSLNQKYANELNRINSMFSAIDCGGGIIEFFFPFRLGATGVDLKCRLDSTKQLMEIFSDLAIMDDLLKWPFISYATEKKENFPRIEKNDSKRKEKIIIFEPAFPLAICRVNLAEEKLFSVYRDNVLAFFQEIMTEILEWADYGQFLADTINTLLERLKEKFPESEGWRVGAPESERLDAFDSNASYRRLGKINVFKKSWQHAPSISSDNTNGRGLLSFTLESGDALLGDLYIGILKNEPWYDLGDLSELLNKADLIGASGKPDEYWPWWQSLEATWNHSGLSKREWTWRGKKLQFVDYCVNKFLCLKELEPVIDSKCHEIPGLQKKTNDWFNAYPDRQKWTDGLYVYNRLRIIADEIATINSDTNLNISFSSSRLLDHWIEKEIYLKMKVAEFDAVAAIKCSQKCMKVEFKNIDPPDFETDTIKAFIANRNIYTFAEEKVSNEYDGGTVSQWFDRFADFAKMQAEKLLPEFTALKQHLVEVVKLADSAGAIIGETLGTGWRIDNISKSLEKDAPINIWHSSWIKNGAKDDDLPPLMLQIIPTKPCFDGLIISLRQNEQIVPQYEHNLGMVCGACEFAFGEGHYSKDCYGVWSTTLPLHSTTGGSTFEKPLIADVEMSAFEKYLNEVANSIKRMEPLISSLCKDNNEQVHFIGGMNSLIDGLTKSIEGVFPAKDGWKITSNAKSLERYASIRIFKESWKKVGYAPGALTIAIEAGQANFDDLYYGIIDLGLLVNEEKEKLRETMNNNENLCYGRQSNTWPWYKYAEYNARLTGGRDKKAIDEMSQEVMQRFFIDKLYAIKTDVVPVIDNLLTGTDDGSVVTH